jgi:neopullulanase
MNSIFHCARQRFRFYCASLLVSVVLLTMPSWARPQAAAEENAPVVKSVEPPNWWVGLTPEVMLLLSGKNLGEGRTSCNLPEVRVSRTQSTERGSYLFVWLKFAPTLKSGTVVCRIQTPRAETSFELPIATRKQILGRNQGLSLDDVIYLIMPDRFANGDPTNDEPLEFKGSCDRANPRAYHGGDLQGIKTHLPYLSDLGVTTLWLTPIVKNGATQDYHGYSAVDLYAVDPHVGTVEDYRELVTAAHQQHMKVFFDAVLNHVGPLHPWVKNPPTADWFHGTATQHLNTFPSWSGRFYGEVENKEQAHDAFELLADPHAPALLRKNITDGWFLGVLPDLNTENPLVAQYLVQNSIWWAESSGLDGYRLDKFPYVSRAFWAQWHVELRRIYPRLSSVGEIYHPDPTVTSFFAGGRKAWDGIDTQLTTEFDYPMYFALRDVLLKDAPAGQLANILRQDGLYPHPEFLVPFFGNHDVPRFASLSGATPAKLKLAYGLALTLRGIPELYYGDEIGMLGGADPENRRDFAGGWTEDKRSAFTREGRTAEQQDIFEYVQSLLRVRIEHDALRNGKLTHLSADESAYVFLRNSDEEKLVIAFHKGASPRELTILLGDTVAKEASGAVVIFGKGQADVAGRQLHLKLPAESISIFQLQ